RELTTEIILEDENKMKFELYRNESFGSGDYVLKIIAQTDKERRSLANFYNDCRGGDRKIILRHEATVIENPSKNIESMTFMTDLGGGE
ncbi:MAG: hypothetical protein Q8N88_03095, partial [Nanoarchaeota archaeon]|nr:hypothetical protein [Nanoarchaeota archaeon]